jgi:hypothetical protein
VVRIAYAFTVTAKESLREAIDEMSEVEAQQLLEQVRRAPASRIPSRRGGSDNAAAWRLVSEWWSENQDVSDEEVAEFDRMLANLEPVRFREWRPE